MSCHDFHPPEAQPGGSIHFAEAVHRQGRTPNRVSFAAAATGAKSPKSKWRFSKVGEAWFCFAGLWRPAQGDVPESFTLLTTAPGPDVAPIHNRQVVVLERSDWQAWLDLPRPEADLLRPLPAGSLAVEQVR